MENLRPILWIAALVMCSAVWVVWQRDYAPAVTTPVVEAPAPPPTSVAGAATPGTSAPAAAATAAAAPVPANLPPVHIRTDVLDLELDLVGGDLRSARLPAYPVHKEDPGVPVQLLNPDAAQRFVFHTGLRAAGAAAPAVYTAEKAEYTLEDGASEVVVTLRPVEPGPVAIEKVWTFRRGRYDVGLEIRVHNGGDAPWRAAGYVQIERRHAPPERSYFNVDSYSFTGPVAYDGQKYQKIKLENQAKEPFRQDVANGWIASIQHHFLAAAVPPAGVAWNYDLAWDGHVYTLNAVGPATDVAPGSDAVFPARLFVGPKLQAQLVQVAPGLDLTVDYGALTIIAQPLFWLLQKIHGLIGNWGWAIIIATFLIKAVFYKLTQASGRSMAKMRNLQPRLQALQQRYADDRQKLSEAMMELYKKEKVNPAAGCLPMLIQIPFFIAYYWVLLESVEMRQAPFALWITDLSSRDPFFVLPLLNAAALYLQQSLNPPPPDPVQAKLMKFMPLVFGGMFAFFPSGLVLYWLTNSGLSILQQWRINKVIART